MVREIRVNRDHAIVSGFFPTGMEISSNGSEEMCTLAFDDDIVLDSVARKLGKKRLATCNRIVEDVLNGKKWIVEIVEDELFIKVGSTLHPMTKEHYIQWVIVKNDDRCYEVELFPEQDPVVRVPLLRNATVFAYCNLHGLWKTEIK